MRRTFDLAMRGRGFNKTNPIVGALLADQRGRVRSEGFYRRFGGPHAEVDCLAEIMDVSPMEHLYVSLEPCNIVAKTPPCSQLILEKKIKHLHVACVDSNPDIAGSSLRYLQQAGIEVESNVEGKTGQGMHRQFFVNTTHKRPYIILKWAESKDGFVGRSGERTKLSNWASDILVHRWRAESDAILVGTNTALVDNPQLNVRHYFGANPTRIVLDRSGLIPRDSRALQGTQQTYLLGKEDTTITAEHLSSIKYDDTTPLTSILTSLYQKDVGSILVEGGPTVHQYLYENNYWDEIRIIRSPILLDDGIPSIKPVQPIGEKLCLLNDEAVCIFRETSAAT